MAPMNPRAVIRFGRALIALGTLDGCRSGAEPDRASPAHAEWVDPRGLQHGPLQPTALSPAQIARIGALQRTLAEVDPSPLASWIDDFSRDVDPEPEIVIYETIAAAYVAYVARRAPDLATRREAYQLLIRRSGAPAAEVLAHYTLEQLTPDQARDVMQGYAAPPHPVEVRR